MSTPNNIKPTRQCQHVDYEPITWGIETGVMIGGASPCYSEAETESQFCYAHRYDDIAAQPKAE